MNIGIHKSTRSGCWMVTRFLDEVQGAEYWQSRLCTRELDEYYNKPTMT